MTRKDAVEVELISLRARLEAARGYVLNTSMQVECNVLRRQIEALEREVVRIEAAHD